MSSHLTFLSVKIRQHFVAIGLRNIFANSAPYSQSFFVILPKYRRSPGFTDEERAGFTNLLAKGFTFRHLHGDIPNQYTWWAQRSKTSKINNTGWRIDYWLTSNRVADKVTKSDMIDSGARQDHTPIVMEIEL